VQLDEWHLGTQQRVAQGDARVREGGRIEQNDGDALVARGMYSPNQLGFRIALKSVELVAG